MSFLGVPNGVHTGVQSNLTFATSYSNLFPAALFSAGEPGVWYDPSDYTTLFEDSAGTIPITSPLEKPVGLMLDKSKGLVLGPELITNGDFSQGTTGWTAVGLTIDVVNGELRLTRNGSGQYAYQTITTVAGSAYRVTLNYRNGTSSSSVYVGSTVGGTQLFATVSLDSATTATYSFVFFATGTQSTLAFGVNTLGGTAFRDNISVRELPGNHAYQSASSTSRPTLSARYNAYVGTETLSTQNVTTLAASYKLSFTGTGSITLSGTATGTYLAGTHTITCTAGTLTSTVAGTVTKADLRVTNDGVNLPVYQRVNTATDYDTVGFPLYLRFDGSDDWMVTNTITPGTDKVQVFAGVRKLSDAATGVIAELSADATVNSGAFSLYNSLTTTINGFGFFSRGINISSAPVTSGYPPPVTAVLSGIGNISGDSAILRINGTQAASSTADQGAGNYLAYPLYIGRRGGTTLPFNGRLYSFIARFGTTLSSAQITSTEGWVNKKTGAY